MCSCYSVRLLLYPGRSQNNVDDSWSSAPRVPSPVGRELESRPSPISDTRGGRSNLRRPPNLMGTTSDILFPISPYPRGRWSMELVPPYYEARLQSWVSICKYYYVVVKYYAGVGNQALEGFDVSKDSKRLCMYEELLKNRGCLDLLLQR